VQVLSLCLSLDGRTAVTAGVRHLKYWNVGAALEPPSHVRMPRAILPLCALTAMPRTAGGGRLVARRGGLRCWTAARPC
jgi:hypothetical protein